MTTTTTTGLGLSEAQQQQYQQVFKLSYHLNYLHICQQHIPLRGLDVLEVRWALPVPLVIDHLGCNSWTDVEAPAYDRELGNANQFHRNAGDHDHQQAHASRYRHLYLDIEEIPQEHYGPYDLIFSIACFEHIHRLPQALQVMHRCLRPGGNLFTMHSPIWSAFDGHHLPIGIPERFDQVNPQQVYVFEPWGHLLNRGLQAFQNLAARFDCEFAEEVICYTHNSDHVNRYFSEDYLLAFQASSFVVDHCQLIFPFRLPVDIQQALERRHPGYVQFPNNGILALLSKSLYSAPLIL
jgi:SAM-dependent methyltransferase